jgi:repressor LexA
MPTSTTAHAQVKLYHFYRRHKRMPSYSEIMTLAGFRSKNAVHRLVQRLIRSRIITKDGKGKLIPKKLLAVPVLGTIAAGFPSPAEEELLDTMTLDEYVMGNRAATFLIRVEGDSMIDAGILPGDLVLVERGRQSADGDIVIAAIDGGWTMKYLRKKAGRFILEAANKKYKPIEPQEELVIDAVVMSVIRKYH